MILNRTIDLTGKSGDAIPFSFAFKDAAGDPISLAGAVLAFALKKDLGAEDADADYSCLVSSHDDEAAGLTSFEISAQYTIGLTGEYFYAIKIFWPLGRPFTVVDGVYESLRTAVRRVSV